MRTKLWRLFGYLLYERDQWFESGSLQQRVCKLSVPLGSSIRRQSFLDLTDIDGRALPPQAPEASLETIRASQLARLDPPLKPSRWVKART